jgi:hypothetical protein
MGMPDYEVVSTRVKWYGSATSPQDALNKAKAFWQKKLGLSGTLQEVSISTKGAKPVIMRNVKV